jgi:hypothetical protein
MKIRDIWYFCLKKIQSNSVVCLKFTLDTLAHLPSNKNDVFKKLIFCKILIYNCMIIQQYMYLPYLYVCIA